MTAPRLHATPHLILGAARSGKSAYAEELLKALPPPYVYIATAQPLDREMEARIRLHRARRGADWRTRECPVDLPPLLESLQGMGRPVLVDCLTLWLSNLLGGPDTPPPAQEVENLARVVSRVDYPLFMVSNEVGWGIVPENPLARRFRDLAGAAHQKLARACASVTLVVAGLPLVLKQP